jgi:hypothetical protein
LDEGENYEQVEAEIKAKILDLAVTFDERAEIAFREEAPEEPEEDQKWDCETILSTYTNTDNHPGIIKTERRIRPSKKIELHKAFKVPVEGLMPVAEEILLKKEKIKKEKATGPYK